MKITFVLPIPSLAGGVRVVAIYAGKLLERGHDVRVISLCPRASSRSHRLMQLARHGFRQGRKKSDTTLLDFLRTFRNTLFVC